MTSPAISSTSARSSQRVSPQLKGAIAATAILAFLGLFLETVLNVLFPTLMADFGVNVSDIQWLTSGYLLVVSLVMAITGWLQHRFTPRTLFIVAAASILVGSVVAALAPAYPVLLIGRLVQGIGTGIVTPLMFTIILTQSPMSRIGALMGVGALVLGVAPAMGPIIGGIVGQVTSWRVIFWAAVVLVLISFALGLASITGGHTQSMRLDWRQVTLLAITFVGLILGAERLGTSVTSGESLIVPIVLLVVGVAAAWGFARLSLASDSPIIRLSVLKAPTYRYSLMAFSLFQFAALGLGFLLPNAAQLALGTSTMEAGLLVLPGAVLGAVMAPIGGSLLDKFGPRTPILVGASISLIACIALAAQGTNLSPLWMAGFYFLYMLGFGMAYANTQTHAMAHVDGPLTADGTALMNTVQQFFGAISMTILSAVIAVRQGTLTPADAAYASATASGVFIGFIVVAVIVACALGFEWASMRHSRMLTPERTITAEEILEADEIEAAVLAEMSDEELAAATASPQLVISRR